MYLFTSGVCPDRVCFFPLIAGSCRPAAPPSRTDPAMLQYVLYTTLLLTRLHAAVYAIIPDCDEVFNFWEPLNFLTRFFGKQTWEYSPEYAIRSYAYLAQYSLLIYPISWLKYALSLYHVAVPSYTLFYLVRVILAASFTLAEIKLSKSLKFLNKNIQNWFLLSQILSPGMYQAAVSILPSSYTLLFGIISTTYIIHFFNTEKFISSIDTELVNLEDKANTIKDAPQVDELAPRTNMLLNLYRVSSPLITKSYTMATLLTAVAGFVGWPFSMVLIVPFITYSLINSLVFSPKSVLKNDYSVMRLFSIYLLSGLSCVFFIAYFIAQFDSLFYKKTAYVGFNILSYNVFHASDSTGPDIFGTEDFLWYFKNLLLNFHIFFVIGALNFLTLFNRYQLVIYKLPLLIWFGIFVSQAHKEERFMYPIYHLISISFAQFMSCETFNVNCFTKITKKILNYVVLSTTVFLFLTRVNNMNTNYSAPINVFKYLSDSTVDNHSSVIENVCIGREWYHYPSSLFLNDNQRLKFTQSSFDGMLPGDFLEPAVHSFEGLVKTTSAIPAGFNNMNKYNPDFVVSSSECSFYVDIDMKYSAKDATSLENPEWEILYCETILDADNSSGIEKSLSIKSFIDDFIVKPWFKLQSDLSTIELNRKLMEMYGIEDADGTKMFDGLYANLNTLQAFINENFSYIVGEVKMNNFCVARRR